MDPKPPIDPFDVDDEREVSESEREQIFGQIDRVIESVRTPLEEELKDLRPRKRGGLFPIAVNVAAAVCVVAGVFLLSGFFKVRNERITVRSAGLVSAEGNLLAALRRESDALIRDKENQIDSIERRLQAVDRESQELRARLGSDLKLREEELRAKLEAELAGERKRLLAVGTSGSALNRQILALERRQEAALLSELDQYKGELEGGLRRREQELGNSRDQLQAVLAAASDDRTRLEAELSERQGALTAQFEREREVLRREAGAAERRLAALQEAGRQERLLEDQLYAYYRDALDRLGTGDFPGALDSVAGLEALLDSPALIRTPALLERRSLDRALAAALTRLIRMNATPAVAELGSSPDAPGAAEQAQVVEELRGQIVALEKTIEGLRSASRQRSVGDSASGREQIAELESRAARLAADLAADLAAGAAETARLERWKSNVDGLSGRYAEARTRARRLVAQGGEADLREAQRLLLQALRDPTAAAILPGLADELQQVDRLAAALNENSGQGRGREAALTEVLRYLNYLSRGTGSREVEAQVMAQARQDPVYRAVIREIQILSAGGSSAVSPASPYILLGTVVSTSGPQVVIEPLGNRPVSNGATVQIRRSDALGQETLIARGTVEQTRGGEIYARVDSLAASGASLQLRDLVYVESR